ncbi:MAG: hypothetical protein Q9P14_05270 [candidate division KSB1 bacterium]|nr:hypothetical protein [candidate division KSB1 bacterium]
MALEGKELLGNKTPTSALRALAIQHDAEITAESMFYGIEYNINVKERFREIEREVKSISRWFHRSSRKRSELNARLTIIENLAKRFRDLNQFEEEQQCLAEARKLRFEFWMRQGGTFTAMTLGPICKIFSACFVFDPTIPCNVAPHQFIVCLSLLVLLQLLCCFNIKAESSGFLASPQRFDSVFLYVAVGSRVATIF